MTSAFAVLLEQNGDVWRLTSSGDLGSSMPHPNSMVGWTWLEVTQSLIRDIPWSAEWSWVVSGASDPGDRYALLRHHLFQMSLSCWEAQRTALMPFVSKELKENTDPGMGNANMNDIDRMSSIYSPYILRISSSLKSRWRCKLASAEAPFLRDLKTRMIFLETSFHGKTCFEDCSRECFFWHFPAVFLL